MLPLDPVGAVSSRAAPEGAALFLLVLFFASFLAGTLAGKRGFHTLLFAGLQVKGVALNLLDNVFLLHLAFKPAQSVLEGFPLLKPYFCQTDTPPNSSCRTEYLLQGFDPKSSERSSFLDKNRENPLILGQLAQCRPGLQPQTPILRPQASDFGPGHPGRPRSEV